VSTAVTKKVQKKFFIFAELFKIIQV